MFYRVFQSLCMKKMCEQVSVGEYMLFCCPKGTYVRWSGQLLSFKRERDPTCPQLWPVVSTRTEQDPFG